MTNVTVVCLLQVRNGSAHISQWLNSARLFSDAVIAIDDGSTDESAALLLGDPLVIAVLRNPVRPTSVGWDDAANRQALVDELGRQRTTHPMLVSSDAVWAVSLDADERIGHDDAHALRSFLHTDADPGRAYVVRVFRMLGDGTHWDRVENWNGRIFPHRPGARLTSDQMHVSPIPGDFPRNEWIRTSLRFTHLANVDEQARQDRFDKYQQNDAGGQFQRSYGHLLDAPEVIRPWTTRDASLPVVIGPKQSLRSSTRRRSPWQRALDEHLVALIGEFAVDVSHVPATDVASLTRWANGHTHDETRVSRDSLRQRVLTAALSAQVVDARPRPRLSEVLEPKRSLKRQLGVVRRTLHPRREAPLNVPIAFATAVGIIWQCTAIRRSLPIDLRRDPQGEPSW
jgi:hypothetical protein